jgi:AcrR family transcriptional regulator
VTKRDAAAERTRGALLDAGLAVAERVGLAGMSVNRVVAAAGVAKGTFYVHFPDRGEFLRALHARFHDQVTRVVVESIEGMEPGPDRLRRGMGTYLDACLQAGGVKALLLEARNDGTVADQVALRNDAFAELAAPDLRAMGWQHPAAAARLLIAMSAEVALVELAYGRRDSISRRVLWRMLERADLGNDAGE